MADELRSFSSWQRSLRNFDFLTSAVPGGMDIDLMVERAGNFLFIEGKHYNHGIHVNYGQHKALFSLCRQPNTTVYLIGETDGLKFHLLRYDPEVKPQFVRKGRVSAYWAPERFIPVSRNGLTDVVVQWWETNVREVA